MIKYYGLGAEKRLNEIVMAGSHDAGITGGGGNAQTQKLDILGQALAGVRLFDLRIAGADSKKSVELKTYHGKQTKSKVTKNIVGLQGGAQKVVQSRMALGTWGESLLPILADARGFVTTYSTEFLLLKFDKCKNWEQIAALAVQELGNTLYTASGNLNKKTLADLKGKVIVLFTSAGLAEIDQQYHGAGGILGIKNLSSGGDYKSDYNGLQYYGKGGTDLTTRKGKSIQENYDKQLKLMKAGAAENPNVMGMMYWTTTGVVGNIRKRNKVMWQPQNITELQRLWSSGMGDAVKERIPDCIDASSYVGGLILKRFLPNIVMIDFASPRKCQTIFDLNRAIPTELTKMEQLMIEIRKLV